MEYIKTQLQLGGKGNPLPYNGMISGLTYTVRSTGFLSLYRGLAPTLVGSIPKAGIRFGENYLDPLLPTLPFLEFLSHEQV
jgi:solute carrier family 25 citrate transporter 1